VTVPAYRASSVLALPDGSHLPLLRMALADARRQILASLFLVDMRLTNDPQRHVRSLVEILAYAAWKRVEVRILLSVPRNRPGNLANTTAALYMRDLGIAVRLFETSASGGFHAKFIVIDGERVITGSHNWTHGSLVDNRELSVCVSSNDLAAHAAHAFDALWGQAQEPPADAI
jgi:phosphatidylserine/phosphatidylglycerophosphate/cardiolipin synthase-like enzyme